jgi:hypothetical protein
VHGGDGADAQGVALAAPHGDALVERGALGGLQLGRAEEVGDLARHVEDDRQLRGRDARVAGRVLGQEIGDSGADRAAADAVVAREGGDGPALQPPTCAGRRRPAPGDEHGVPGISRWWRMGRHLANGGE